MSVAKKRSIKSLFSHPFKKRVFVGGNYDHLNSRLKPIATAVRKVKFFPVIAWDYEVEKGAIHDTDLMLLHCCSHAIFDVTSPAGELMEIERTRDYRTRTLVVYEVREEGGDPPESLTSMVSTFGTEMKGWASFKELRAVVADFLTQPKPRIIDLDQVTKITDLPQEEARQMLEITAEWFKKNYLEEVGGREE